MVTTSNSNSSPTIIVTHENQVPLWTVEDVVSWVTQVGFKEFAPVFDKCGVDGDMLLQLIDSEIKDDIGIVNGILRKRFLRELKQLKVRADYTSCDGGITANFLARISPEFKVYSYNLILKELTLDFMRRLSAADLEDMLRDAGVESAIHRHRMIEAVIGGEDDSFTESLYSEPSVDVYLSYPSTGGAELASLIQMQLEMRGVSVLSGPHDHRMNDSVVAHMRDCRHYVLVLPPGGLDTCLASAPRTQDRLYLEVLTALHTEMKIVPVTSDFQWPEYEELAEEIRGLSSFNGVRWVHDYQDACLDKLERFLRPETLLRPESPYSYKVGRSRGDSGRSTPSTSSPLLLQKLIKHRTISIDSALGSQST